MSDPNVPINHPGGPTFTQRLWTEAGEVLIQQEDIGYEFSNGRRFRDPKPQPV
jgi:hypothetical protein